MDVRAAIRNLLGGSRSSNVRGYTDGKDSQETEEIAQTWRDPYVTGLLNAYAGTGKKVFTENPDPVLSLEGGLAGVGYSYPLGIYRELLDKDARAFTAWQQRKGLTLDGRLTVVPDGEDSDAEDAADLLRTALTQLQGGGLQGFIDGLLSAVPYGFHVPEAIWAVDEMRIMKSDGKRGAAKEILWAKRFCSRDQRRFKFDADGNPRLVTLARPLDGEPLPPYRFLPFRPYAEYENPYGDPLLRRVYWLCKIKKIILKFWPDLCERYGMPLVAAKPGRVLSASERTTLKTAIDDLRQNTGLVLPFLTELELIESGKAGSEIYSSLIMLLDSYIAGVIIGQDFTVAQAEKGGTRSAGEIYAEAASRIARMDATALARYLTNDYGRLLTDLNFGYNRVPYPKVIIDTSTVQDKMNRVIMYQGLSQIGFPISSVEIEDTVGVQQALDGDDALVAPQMQAAAMDARPPYDKTQNPKGASNQGGIKKPATQAQNK